MSLKLTRHFIRDIRTGRSVRLTGITAAQQYARLTDFFGGEWAHAARVQQMFNDRFPRAKRARVWTPNYIIQ